MKLEQIYTGCLAQAAYYLESNGKVAIFDPLREVGPYIEKANSNGAEIKYIFETHFHADFVSGHIDLASKTGATIVYGPNAEPAFDALIATDGQEFKVGNCTVKAIHTPGHTMESTCYLIIDESGNQQGIITGDTLFIGDVGRPDLAQSLIPGLTQEILAGHLYDSLRNKIMPMADDLIIYPSHGAGSACGKNISRETTDTLGHQKETNYALRADMSKEEFIAALLDGLGAPPAYFPQNVMMNINGYDSLDNIISKSLKWLDPMEFRATAQDSGAVVLDVRHESEFVKSHIPGSVFIGIQGNFAPWVGAILMDVNIPLLLVAPDGREEETITRLSRIGFDNVLGFLKGGISAWEGAGLPTDSVSSITPEEFEKNITPEAVIVDSRKPGEFQTDHIENAINLPLDNINSRFEEIPDNHFYVHCAGGYRSVIMASIMKSRGIHNFTNIEKGMSGIRETKIPIVKPDFHNH